MAIVSDKPDRASLLETGLSQAGRFLRENQGVLLTGAAAGLLAHGFALSNKLVNHDEVASLFSKGGTVVLGRWGLGFLDVVFPNVSMPWLYGLLTILFILLAGCSILCTLRIQNKVVQGLFLSGLVVFPSLTGTMCYMFTSCPFALAFLLACVAAGLMARPDWKRLVLALGCMIASLSIYQSYISLAAGLLLVMLLRRVLAGDAPKAIVRHGALCLVFLVAALGIYYLLTQLVLQITGVSMGSYAADSISFQVSQLPGRILLAYQSFCRIFTQQAYGLLPTPLAVAAHGFLVVSALALLGLAMGLAKADIAHTALAIAFLALLPLAVACMFLFTTPEAVHTLVLYGFVSLYALFALAADWCLPKKFPQGRAGMVKKGLVDLSAIAAVLILVSNIYVANQVYLNLHLRYENAQVFYTGLISQLQQQPDFTPETKLAVIGYYQEPDFYELSLPETYQITGARGFLPSEYSKARFLEYYCGFPIPVLSQEAVREIAETEEFQKMPVYPYYGSMKMIGDVFVVKLSQP